MIVGCGIDIEERERFTKHLVGIHNSEFIKFVYTPDEISNYKSNYQFFIPISFCCKEAFFKAIGNSWTTSPVCWHDIELLFNHSQDSKYEIKLSGFANQIYKDLNCPRILSEYHIDNEKASFEVILIHE